MGAAAAMLRLGMELGSDWGHWTLWTAGEEFEEGEGWWWVLWFSVFGFRRISIPRGLGPPRAGGVVAVAGSCVCCGCVSCVMLCVLSIQNGALKIFMIMIQETTARVTRRVTP